MGLIAATSGSAQQNESESLLHYWNFNVVDELLISSFSVGESLEITAELLEDAEIEDGGGNDFFGENARFGDPVGRHLRVNNPLNATLFIPLPTTGYEDPVLKYEARRSGQGAGIQQLSYTLNGDDYVLFDEISIISGTPILYTFDFSSVEGASDNPDFGVRITFAQGDGGTGGNNRIDNITLEGNILAESLEFFSKAEGNLSETDSWGNEPDGSGSTPSSFALDNTTFTVVNRTEAVLTDELEITGTGSRFVVGNGSDVITLTLEAALSTVVDLSDAASLRLTTADYPTFGSLAAGAIVIFSEQANNIPYLSYPSLVLDNISPVFQGNGQFSVSGDLSLLGEVPMPDARGVAQYDVFFVGDGNQLIDTGSNVLRSYNLEFAKTAGSVEVATGSRLSSDNQMVFNFPAGSSFSDNGGLFYAGNSLNIAGVNESYNFTGTFILSGTEPGIVNGAGAGNNFNVREGGNSNITASLQNLIIRAPNTGGEFRMRDGSADVFEIKGDFIVESSADGRIRFYDNDVIVGGDFIIEPGFSGSIDRLESLRMNGNDSQTIQTEPALRTKTITIANNDGILLESGEVQVRDFLEFEAGKITTAEDALLVLESSTQVTGAGEGLFVEGNLAIVTSETESTTYSFPMGTGEIYRPVQIISGQDSASETQFFVRSDAGPAPVYPFPDSISELAADHYFVIDRTGDSQPLNPQLRLSVNADEVDFDASELRIVADQAGSWQNLGGSLNGPQTIISAPYSFGDGARDVALARVALDASKSITAFRFTDFSPPIDAEIDEAQLQITAVLPVGTDVSSLTPEIEITGVSVNPPSGLSQDFSDSVIYTVTAQDGSTAEYTVMVNVEQPPVFELTLSSDPAGAGVLSGDGFFEAGEQVTVTAEPTSGFLFINWQQDGTVQSTSAEYTFEMPANNLSLTAVFDQIEREALAYFFFFGNDLPNNTPLTEILPSFSLSGSGQISYESALEGYPFDSSHPNWRKASLERRNAPTEINYQPEGNSGIPFVDANMRGIQVKQPFADNDAENTVIFELPANGIQNPILSMAVQDEGAADGLVFDYSVSAGEPVWQTEGMEQTEFSISQEYQLLLVDFAGIEAITNNPDFKIRMRFLGNEPTVDNGDRVTFNNIALHADLAETGDEPVALAFGSIAPAGQAGVVFTAFEVRAVNADGVTATDFEGDISLSLPGDVQEFFTGTTTVAAVNGVAVFDDLVFALPAVFQIEAAADELEPALGSSIQMASVSEVVMPLFIQGEQDENNDNLNRIPFVYRLTLEGLTPGAEYRYGNRVVTEEDNADSNGAGNAIFVKTDGSDFIRTTSSPRFRPEDENVRHSTFTADESGRFTGWFITEPSGNARFTPGNLLQMRVLLNDGNEGEETFFSLTAPSQVEVIEFGAEPGTASGIFAASDFDAKNAVLFYDNESAEGRPLAASFVESTGAVTDDRYAPFYDEMVNGSTGFFGTLLPNTLPDGLRALVVHDLITAEMIETLTSSDGVWGDVSTVNPTNGLNPLFLQLSEEPEAPLAPELISPEDGATDLVDFLFTWSEVDLADVYEIEFVEIAGDDPQILSYEAEETELDLNDINEFAELTSYSWRVRGIRILNSGENDGEGDDIRVEGEWSESRTFTTPLFNSLPGDELPISVELTQNYPNPFNPATNIRYALPEAANVRIEVYNIAGQRVATLIDTQQNAGWHTVQFDGSRLSSGVYLYRLETGNTVQVRKMLLLK